MAVMFLAVPVCESMILTERKKWERRYDEASFKKKPASNDIDKSKSKHFALMFSKFSPKTMISFSYLLFFFFIPYTICFTILKYKISFKK